MGHSRLLLTFQQGRNGIKVFQRLLKEQEVKTVQPYKTVAMKGDMSYQSLPVVYL